jgi:SecD/SecF fusion protein
MDEAAGRDVLDRSYEIIRNRVDAFGLSEPILNKSGDSRIIASLAGMGAEDARNLIGATALLEFKLVAEPEEFRPLLDRLDAFLAARKKGGSVASAQAARPRNQAEDVFGRVVGGDSAGPAVSVGSDTAAADSAVALADNISPDSRPFSALLVAMGRDIGVASSDVEIVRGLLKDREVQQIIPTRLQFLWAR